jgi:hypothetical protein
MKRTSWILLILLILALGAYWLFQVRADRKALEATETPVVTSYLIEETDSILVSARLYDQDYHIVELQRTQDGFWEVTLPTLGAADQALATEAETQINALRIVSTLGHVTSLDDFGLTFPAYNIKLVYSNGVSHVIEVGGSAPTGSGYYVRLDAGDVFIVSQYSLDAVLTLISSPPYPATATPTP